MLLQTTKRNAALSMLVHLVLLVVLWMVSVRPKTRKIALGERSFVPDELTFFHYLMATFLVISILMLVLRYAGKMKNRFPFLYQFTGIGNLVYGTLGLMLLIMGAGQGILVLIILSFLTGFFIEKDIFTADAGA